MSELDDFMAAVRARATQTWGFAIYRTAYGGATTDAPWRSLLEAIHTNLRTEVLGLRVPRERCEEFLSLLKLDVREDQSILQGASMDRVREMIKESDPRPTDDEPLGGTLTTLQGVFLYVDDEVLEAAAQTTLTAGSRPPWVKMVELDYNPEQHKGNRRVGPQSYFGWMKLSTGSLFQLWQDLQGQDLWKLAPRNPDERQLTIWDGVLNNQM
ncbi:hypothetical protein B0T17DRAFT_621153 [Bombardia bombarda]|uniref:Uncharacterized protein n=1 Tax=Bombardia bombarda TaxID=252184 RepID=A0AA39W9W3_9PEZI|nr:hypothetical protein B0T17DRAFT_621153 [Bombardia bombarda]